MRGVFPIFTGISASTLGLPHMRGGVSSSSPPLETAGESSPHAWGCFYSMTIDSTHQFVFPTCVGVFPRHLQTVYLWSGLPHMRGGVSCFIRSDGSISASSPHAWGCFFSNVIDGFLAFSLPHMREGCFHWLWRLDNRQRAFSTCVGVFSPFK